MRAASCDRLSDLTIMTIIVISAPKTNAVQFYAVPRTIGRSSYILPFRRFCVDAITSEQSVVYSAAPPLGELADDDFRYDLSTKLIGLSRKPMVGSAVISFVNPALEGFARAAALEAPRGICVNVVSPPWVKETLKALTVGRSGTFLVGGSLSKLPNWIVCADCSG